MDYFAIGVLVAAIMVAYCSIWYYRMIGRFQRTVVEFRELVERAEKFRDRVVTVEVQSGFDSDLDDDDLEDEEPVNQIQREALSEPGWVAQS